MMEYVTLKKTGLKVARLGMGTLRFPLLENSKLVDEDNAVSLLQYGLFKGLNYIDTGYTYHGGKSEEIVGKAICQFDRSKVIITTKCPIWEVTSEDEFDRILEDQLKKLRTSYIDCYLIHALGESRWNHVKKCGIMKMMEKARKKGIIRHIGFSFHDSYSVFEKIILEYPHWEICQLQYNYIDTDKQAGTKGITFAKNRGLDVFIMEPLHGGRLVHPPEQVEKTLIPEKSPTEWAFDFLYDNPNIDIVLSGMSNKNELDDNILFLNRSFPGMLSIVERDMFSYAKQVYDTMSLVKCTGCNYCAPCDNGIDIPYLISLYNMVGKSHYRDAKEEYDLITNNASMCVGCKLCESRCPQNLQISSIMISIHKTFQKPLPEIDLESLRIKWPERYEKIKGDGK